MWLRGAVARSGVERVKVHGGAAVRTGRNMLRFPASTRNRPMVNLLLPLGHLGSDFSTLVLPG
jgi:hypothetical protein